MLFFVTSMTVPMAMARMHQKVQTDKQREEDIVSIFKYVGLVF